MTVSPALSQGVGYGVVIGLGIAFALGMFSTTTASESTDGQSLTPVFQA
jgi:hypothetical protein